MTVRLHPPMGLRTLWAPALRRQARVTPLSPWAAAAACRAPAPVMMSLSSQWVAAVAFQDLPRRMGSRNLTQVVAAACQAPALKTGSQHCLLVAAAVTPTMRKTCLLRNLASLSTATASGGNLCSLPGAAVVTQTTHPTYPSTIKAPSPTILAALESSRPPSPARGGLGTSPWAKGSPSTPRRPAGMTMRRRREVTPLRRMGMATRQEPPSAVAAGWAPSPSQRTSRSTAAWTPAVHLLVVLAGYATSRSPRTSRNMAPTRPAPPSPPTLTSAALVVLVTSRSQRLQWAIQIATSAAEAAPETFPSVRAVLEAWAPSPSQRVLQRRCCLGMPPLRTEQASPAAEALATCPSARADPAARAPSASARGAAGACPHSPQPQAAGSLTWRTTGSLLASQRRSLSRTLRWPLPGPSCWRLWCWWPSSLSACCSYCSSAPESPPCTMLRGQPHAGSSLTQRPPPQARRGLPPVIRSGGRCSPRRSARSPMQNRFLGINTLARQHSQLNSMSVLDKQEVGEGSTMVTTVGTEGDTFSCFFCSCIEMWGLSSGMPLRRGY
mmetsp:Transcript_33571/g.94981  ORF Transcript_33571/g.94981 Transcript_33571/m.94981 type:complete len:553 (-) Transcript_33571:52-1710(-)